MEINPDVQERDKERPDVSAEERASSALLKWIRKLRWIGMEEEAEKLQIVLADFTQRTGGWLVDGSLDCANGPGRRNCIRRIDDKRTRRWTKIRVQKEWLTMTRY
jgi:hypothetical protein